MTVAICAAELSFSVCMAVRWSPPCPSHRLPGPCSARRGRTFGGALNILHKEGTYRARENRGCSLSHLWLHLRHLYPEGFAQPQPCPAYPALSVPKAPFSVSIVLRALPPGISSQPGALETTHIPRIPKLSASYKEATGLGSSLLYQVSTSEVLPAPRGGGDS